MVLWKLAPTKLLTGRKVRQSKTTVLASMGMCRAEVAVLAVRELGSGKSTVVASVGTNEIRQGIIQFAQARGFFLWHPVALNRSFGSGRLFGLQNHLGAWQWRTEPSSRQRGLRSRVRSLKVVQLSVDDHLVVLPWQVCPTAWHCIQRKLKSTERVRFPVDSMLRWRFKSTVMVVDCGKSRRPQDHWSGTSMKP